MGLSCYLSLGVYQYGIQLKRLAFGKELDVWAIFLQKQCKFWQAAVLVPFVLLGGLLCFL